MKQSQQEFDRSKGFMMHGSIDDQLRAIGKQLGYETFYNVYIALSDFGRFGIEIQDEYIKLLAGHATIERIESSQDYRAQCFAGENFELTKVVAEFMRDHPEASQRTIAAATGASKTKVAKVQKTLKTMGFSDIQEYLNTVVYPRISHENVNTVNNNCNNVCNCYCNSETATATSPRDHFVVTNSRHTDSASLTQQAAPAETKETEKTFTYDDEVSVMKLFQQHKRPSEICTLTGFPSYFVNASIDKFRENNNRLPKPPVDHSKMIMCTDGSVFMNKEEYFNDCTNNGKNNINEIPWDIIKENLIEYKAINPDGIINEMKDKLLQMQSKPLFLIA